MANKLTESIKKVGRPSNKSKNVGVTIEGLTEEIFPKFNVIKEKHDRLLEIISERRNLNEKIEDIKQQIRREKSKVDDTNFIDIMRLGEELKEAEEAVNSIEEKVSIEALMIDDEHINDFYSSYNKDMFIIKDAYDELREEVNKQLDQLDSVYLKMLAVKRVAQKYHTRLIAVEQIKSNPSSMVLLDETLRNSTLNLGGQTDPDSIGRIVSNRLRKLKDMF